jgi:ATP-dependent helicase/nuclease subunit A
MIKANDISNKYLASTTNGPADLVERIQSLDVTQSFLVKAPAGSGKTELLSQRYLALLSVVNEPEEILAITFTNKSGNEMRARIINALLKADTQPEPSASHERLTWQLAKNALEQSHDKGWDVLKNPNRLRIKTIDAFYGSLARRAPMVGLIGGGMQITDDYQSCYLKAARDLLGELEQDNQWTNSLEVILNHVDNRFDRAEELLVSLLEKREHWLPIVLSARNTDDLRIKLEDTLKLVALDLISSIKKDFYSFERDMVDVASFAASNLDPEKSNDILALRLIADNGALPGCDCDDIQAWTALSHLFLTKEGSLRKSPTAVIGFPAPSSTNDKSIKALLTDKKAAFKLLIEELADNDSALQSLQKLRALPPVVYQDGEWEVLQHLLMLLPILAAKLLMVFQREGAVDHSEIASSALRVLGGSEEPTDLALILDSQLKHILIDEFQDTNNLQMNGLSLITSGWEPGDGRSLFLVGDPMQSIYSFRGSNVGLFLDVAANDVGSLDIIPVELSVNFRSQQHIVDWVNSTFTEVFPSDQNSNLGAIPYSKSIPHLPAITDKQAISLVGFTGETSIARAAEGKWLAEQIAEIRKNDDSQTVAVLVRNRSHLQSTVTSLQSLGIPYQAIEIDPLKDRHVIMDLSSLTRSLCHLGDRTAWLALLRSPMCGLELVDLEIVANPNSRSLIWENINDTKIVCSLPEDSQERVNRLVSVLRDSMRWRERKSLSTIVEGAWLALFGPSCIEQEIDLENVKAFFKVLGRFTYTTFDTEFFESTLKSLYAKPDVRASNPVQVMTLHKSKGLQFDHVFIPGCERQGRGDNTRLLAWDRFTTSEGAEHPLLSPSPEIGGGANALYQFINKQSTYRADLERDRILYVGCTRAEKHLYLTCSLTASESGEISAPVKRSFMGALWPVIKDQIVCIAVNNEESASTSSHVSTDMPMRLSTINKHPSLPSCDLLAKYRGRMATNNNSLPDLAWKVDYSAQVGQLFHRILRRVCFDGAAYWGSETINARKESWRHQLLQLGVPGFLTPSCINRIIEWLSAVLTDTKGLWLLNNSHESSECELPVSTMLEGELQQCIIDRTFIEDGYRWIVDYKTAAPSSGEAHSLFEARMIEEHSSQLEKYKTIMMGMGQEPVKCAIYLIATQSFVELTNIVFDAAA